MPRKKASELESTEEVAAAKTATKAKSTAKKEPVKKATSSSRKTTTKKAVSNSSVKKTTTRKKSTASKEITSSTDLTKKIEILEYYDLPYRYNETIVKVLAQTPTSLFIYWDISDSDRAKFAQQYGEDFFNTTRPVLIIHNNTMNYSFEVDIDDFANSWYLHVEDSNCEYTIELGRRPKYNNNENNIIDNYLYVTSSNIIDAPNDRVLFDKDLKTVYFKDVKTNIVTSKDITSISFLRNMGKIYSMYDLKNNFSKDNLINNLPLQLDFKNPSSNSSPTFK